MNEWEKPETYNELGKTAVGLLNVLDHWRKRNPQGDVVDLIRHVVESQSTLDKAHLNLTSGIVTTTVLLKKDLESLAIRVTKLEKSKTTPTNRRRGKKS